MQATTDARSEPSLQESPPNTSPVDDIRYDGMSNGHVGADAEVPPHRRARRRKGRWRWLLWALLLLVAIGAIISVLWQPRTVEQLVPAAPKSEPQATATVPDVLPQPPRYPIEPAAAALPPLDASDAAILTGVQSLWANDGILGSYLAPTNLVRNIVVTVDNVPRRTWPVQRLPLKPPTGAFGTAKTDDALTLDSANALRYTPYVRLLDSADSAKLVALYVRNYPLFQQAYRDLGYPNGHFNDRLVEAIDVMIASPDTTGPIKLTQPKVFFQFADRDLEQLPAGQKLLLRMGPEHAKTVKAKLIEIRRLLTAQAPATVMAPANVRR